MTFLRWARCGAAVIVLGAGLSGCTPGEKTPVDQESEPHFLEGKKLASQMDYAGAADAYEKALEADPESGPAHFELACLDEGPEKDPAAAIYHYERFLRLAPNSGKADVARAHINICKLALAESASAIAPITASAQKDLNTLLAENVELRSELAQWQAFYQSHAQLLGSNPPAQKIPTNYITKPAVVWTNVTPSQSNPVSGKSAGTSSTAAFRTHVVAPGDTLAALARTYNISLDALEAANPGVVPTRLRVGAVLNIPAAGGRRP
jgi:LysM repeat protein